MTRINLVPPEELMDQHLFAEFREIKMIPKALARSIKARGNVGVLENIPPVFTLNSGHVMFFYDKGAYLNHRYELIKQELTRRGIYFNRESLLDPDGIMSAAPWFCNYEPDSTALRVIRARIAEKILMKPHWYRHSGKINENPLTES